MASTATQRLRPHHRDRLDAARRPSDREKGEDPAGSGGLQGRQDSLRAHLSGPGLRSGAGRAAQPRYPAVAGSESAQKMIDPSSVPSELLIERAKRGKFG
jgi:hypothetical protein